jgi:uncharacterized protein (TIGR02466 family)
MTPTYKVTPLFGVPLYQTNVGSLDKSMRDFIESQEYERMAADNGDYTVNKYILDTPELAPLKAKIMKAADNFIYTVLDVKRNMDFRMENSWVNRHYTGDYSGQHYHGNSLISGVYYIDTGVDTGAFVCHKDKGNYNLWTETVRVDFNYQDHGNDAKLNFFNADAWGLYPAKNDLIMFPSMMTHSVEENQSSKIRYSLAFNLFPRGTAGGVINTLTV